MKQTITLATGKANFSNTLATYAAMKVNAPFQRISAINSGQQLSQNFAQVGRFDHNGGFMTTQVQHENGVILVLQASWKRGGLALRDGALFLRLRHNATLYTVDAYVPTNAENVFGDRVRMFTGMADIMNEEELALLGVLPNRMYTGKFMLEEELEECFEITIAQEGRAERPQISAISTPEGVQLREVAQEPKRRMMFRNRG